MLTVKLISLCSAPATGLGVAPVTEGELARGVRLLVLLKRAPLLPFRLCSPAEAPGLDTASAHTYSQHAHPVSIYTQSAHTYRQHTHTVSTHIQSAYTHSQHTHIVSTPMCHLSVWHAQIQGMQSCFPNVWCQRGVMLMRQKQALQQHGCRQ